MKLNFRQALDTDLPELIRLLQNDILGEQREDSSVPINPFYIQALEAITRDPNNQLLVAESEGKVVGMLQLTFIPSLTYVGSWRCLVEGVRVHSDYRSQGLGKLLIKKAIELAKQRNCHLIQLTSDKKRKEAIRFYENLGFQASHEGFKLKL